MAKSNYTVRGQTPVADQLFVSTLNKRQKEIIDETFQDDEILSYMAERMDSDKMGDGGQQFEIPITYGENPSGGMVDLNEGLPLDDWDPLEMLYFEAKYAAYNVRWDAAIQRMNTRSMKLFSLIDMKIKMTVKTMRETFKEQFFRGTGVGKSANGLGILIPAQLPANQSTSVGGRVPNADGNEWHRTWGYDMTDLSSATQLEDYLMQAHRQIGLYGGKTDAHFTHPDVLNVYERNQMDFLTTQSTKIGDNNYEMVKYKGKPIFISLDAAENEWRLVDNDSIKFCKDPMFWYHWTGWKEIHNVPILKDKQVVCAFQFARVLARHLACIFNITIE